MRKRRALLHALLAIGACSSSRLLDPVVSHDVSITVDVPGRCVATCDPFSTVINRLGLVRIRNTGTTVAYLQQCGGFPSLIEQVLVNGEWVTANLQNFSCVSAPGPLTVAPGDSLLVNWWFAVGERRMVLNVGTSAALDDATSSTSAGFQVK